MISRNFHLSELIITSTGLPNQPGPNEIDNLTLLVQKLLQPLRDALKAPIVVSSGFRSQAVNNAVGGSRSSQHMRGEAADIKVSGKTTNGATAIAIIRALERIPFDQAIFYHPSKGGHIHLSYTEARPNRRQILYCNRKGDYLDIAELIAEQLP